jgi:hypothetical protein
MREAIAADGDAQRSLLAGNDAQPALRRAAAAYRRSWEAAPPGSYGRLVGYAKASVLAGDNPVEYVTGQLGAEDRTPPACWARALAYLADGNDARADRAADGMRAGSEAFGRAAEAISALAAGDRARFAAAQQAIVADFEGRDTHLTGVPIADTALVLDRLAERRGLAAHPRSDLLPPVDDVRAILTETRVWAVVGCSPDPGRDSHRIAAMLQRWPGRRARRRGGGDRGAGGVDAARGDRRGGRRPRARRRTARGAGPLPGHRVAETWVVIEEEIRCRD